jgi:hypothetical protein
MIRVDKMPEVFRVSSYINHVRFGLESSITAMYGYNLCSVNSVRNQTKTDWKKIIPESAMNKINNSTVINANALLSTLNFFSGEVSNETQSMALTNYGLNDDKLYEGLAILVAIYISYRVITYLFLLRKVKALS